MRQLNKKITEAFSDWDKVDENSFEMVAEGAFQIMTTPQFVGIDCYGMEGEDMDKFINILDKYGYPLYDPQVGERFDNHE